MLISTLSVDCPHFLLTTNLFLQHQELFQYVWHDLQFVTSTSLGTSSLVPDCRQPQQTHPPLNVNVCDDDKRCVYLSVTCLFIGEPSHLHNKVNISRRKV